MKYQIANLVDHLHLGPTLAEWHATEWGHLYAGPGSTWNRQVAEQEFAEMQRDKIPLTLIAVDLTSSALLGSISLIADDELQGFEHLTPWLASLYIVPAARGVGIARALIDAAIDEAARLGNNQVYLFTSGQADYYHKLGWETVADTQAHGHPTVVMTRNTRDL